ncbi:hypothetical protein HPB49_009928 [Dermacentor silvarum]|uniref:Uncharacterized protein n=1 Tax=Dermacentor silvarum TaxID=543639 RepID=A0ACB8CR09_DERSI|nr:hypothetical protein HPB49_009928 [Dermacentor silvarum]
METEFEPDVRQEQEQEAKDLQPRLVHIDGRTAIAVQGEILPDDDIAESEALRHDTSLIIGEQAHETYAYFAAPHDTSKGVIHGIPKTETTADIGENIIHPGNPKAIEAHRIGETTAVLVLFQGQKVPSTVKYGVTIVRCSLYCQHHQVCRTCGKIDHRQDVCPQPNTKVCFACEFPPLKADRPLEERKRSASRSCLRGVHGGDSGRATSHGRESRSRSKRRTTQSARRESRSRERATWSEKVANHHRGKSRTPQIEDTMRVLQQDNANLRAENRNLKAQVRELKQGQAEILRLLRAGQQPAGTTRMDIAQAAQRTLTPTPPPQQVPDQRSATPLIAERTPTTEPPSTAPQHETVEDMEEHTAEISRPSFKEHRAMNRERESNNARLNRHEKRIELLEKRLTALELRALTEAHANDNGALYVDAAKYKDKEDTYVAVAIRATTGEIYSACSVRAKQAHQAEEAAIALALADNKCTTILSDSRTAVRNYGRNNVCASAVRVMKCSDRQCRWFPAHQGCYFGSTSPNRNEKANAAARAEGVATDDEDDEEEAELVTSYADVLEWYRSARRSMPDPHPQLTREQAVLYRQLQTNSVLTPALARFICPDVYESAKCSVCNSATATLTHVLWDCKLNPEEAAAYPGRLQTDIASAVTGSGLRATATGGPADRDSSRSRNAQGRTRPDPGATASWRTLGPPA